MFRPQRVLAALALVIWAGMVIACGGAGNGVPASQPKGGTSPPASGVEPAGLSSSHTKTEPASKAKLGKPWVGKLGTGPTAYDELPEPWRGQFVAEWKSGVKAQKLAVSEAERLLEKTKATVASAEKAVDDFKAKYEGRMEGFILETFNEKKAALVKARAAVQASAAAFDAEQAKLAKMEKNDPPYFNRSFDGCKTARDIERRVAEIETEKIADAKQREEDEAKRDKERKEAAARQKAEEEYESDGLVLLKKTVESTINQFGGSITGTIVNSTGRKLRYAEIKFILYDASDAQVGTARANITDLEPGARWNFKASSFGTKFASYKFSAMESR